MPRLSDTMTEGTISKWLKRQGEEVKKGEPIVEIETDKANIELEAYASGKLARIVLQEGQSAPVGELIGEIALPGESTSPAAAAPEGRAAAAPSATQAETTAAAVPAQAPARPEPEVPRPPAAAEPEGAQLRASPMARRLARELGVDLAAVKGSGPLGRIQKEDVEAAAQAKPAAPAPAEAALAAEDVEVVALTRMQQTIARRMVEAKSQVPHFYVSIEVDMDRAVANLDDLNEGAAKEDAVTINDLILRACALALRDYPDVNSFYQDGKLIRNKRINVGFAVAVQGGLIEPVLRDADQKGLKQLAAETKALTRKMREGKAEPHDYEGGTFSISNLGMYGVTEFSAIINPPHSAILAIGAVQDKAVVVDGQLRAGKRCTLTLSADHRVFYGTTAAEFLRAVKHKLEKPLQLFT
jgi:pyruvate dehydrogenase E2 component (dihydrolipoamide acetyltransferase)